MKFFGAGLFMVAGMLKTNKTITLFDLNNHPEFVALFDLNNQCTYSCRKLCRNIANFCAELFSSYISSMLSCVSYRLKCWC